MRYDRGGIPSGAKFESDGTLIFSGGATVWEDMQMPGFSMTPGATAPTLVSFGPSGSLKAYAFAGTGPAQSVHFSIQLPHSWAGTDVSMHIHWAPTDANAGDVQWNLEYSWATIDSAFGAPTTITVVQAASGVAWAHQIISFPLISATGKGISSILMCRLFRDSAAGADTYGSSAIILQADAHVELNSLGSREMFSK